MGKFYANSKETKKVTRKYYSQMNYILLGNSLFENVGRFQSEVWRLPSIILSSTLQDRMNIDYIRYEI